MMLETKRDVFDDAVFQAGKSLYMLHDIDYAESILDGLNNRYAAALPDDLPVIPKAVGEYIQERKAAHDSLSFALTARCIRIPNEVTDWLFMVTGGSDTELCQIEYVKQQDIFARAWLLGVWRVEETGEIVKLEEEK